MADPIALLRDAAQRADLSSISITPTTVHFPSTGHTFASTTPVTAFVSKTGAHYPLSAAVFLAQNHQLKHIDYLQLARQRHVPNVTLPDRRALLELLLGVSPYVPAIGDIVDTVPFSVGVEGGVAAVEFSLEERPLKDRNALLECQGRDFLAVITASKTRYEERQRLAAVKKDTGSVGIVTEVKVKPTAVEGVGVGSGLGNGFSGMPMILVPSASQTLITIYNVKEFLEDGVFVSSEEKAKVVKERPEKVMVQKKITKGEKSAATVVFEVRDKPATLKKEDWERVVAVFALGKEWQFKDWPFEGPLEIFNKMIGFYVRFEDDSIESAKLVKNWNVRIISISKNKRHQDRTAALEIWDRVEKWMQGRSH